MFVEYVFVSRARSHTQQQQQRERERERERERAAMIFFAAKNPEFSRNGQPENDMWNIDKCTQLSKERAIRILSAPLGNAFSWDQKICTFSAWKPSSCHWRNAYAAQKQRKDGLDLDLIIEWGLARVHPQQWLFVLKSATEDASTVDSPTKRHIFGSSALVTAFRPQIMPQNHTKPKHSHPPTASFRERTELEMSIALSALGVEETTGVD